MQERVTYERIANRVMQQERQKAAAQLLLPVGKKPAAGAVATVRGTGAQRSGVGGQGAHQLSKPLGVTLPGSSFKELIAATRQRDAARKAAAGAQQKRPEQQQPEQQQPLFQQQAWSPAEEGKPAEGDEGWESDVDAELWGDQLPLSQVQQPSRLSKQSRQQAQQEQAPPNFPQQQQPQRPATCDGSFPTFGEQL